jgi:endonuclease III
MIRLSFVAPPLVSVLSRVSCRGRQTRLPPAMSTAASRSRSRSLSPSPTPSQSPRKRRVPLAVAEVPSAAELPRMHAKAERIAAALTSIYPVAPAGFLDHRNDFTLLVAVVLSAQTTDVKVNEVTPALFDAADNPRDMAALGVDRVLELIRTVGLAPGKSRNIVGLSERIVEEHSGEVPRTFDELEGLPGVGHKTASVLMMQAHGIPAFPVDTHIHRLACRWGCGVAKSVEKTEANLKLWFPDETTWGELHTRIILFGREHCHSRKHDMDACPVCSFAATDEARRLNASNPTKFVAAPKHADPYSIQEVTTAKPIYARARKLEVGRTGAKSAAGKGSKRAREAPSSEDAGAPLAKPTQRRKQSMGKKRIDTRSPSERVTRRSSSRLVDKTL